MGAAKGNRDVTKPGVLYITYGYPWPLNSGMRLRDYHLIRAVSSRFAVSLLSLMERPEEAQYLEALHPYCASVDAVLAERRSKTHRVVGLTGCVLRNRPVQTHMLGYPAMSAKVREIAEKQDVRIAQIEHSYMAHFAEALPPGHRCRTILDFQDVGFVQYRRMLGLRGSLVRKARYLLEWWSANRWEIRYAQQFDQCVAVSPDDAQALRRASPDLAVAVVDNGVDTDDLRPFRRRPAAGTSVRRHDELHAQHRRRAVLCPLHPASHPATHPGNEARGGGQVATGEHPSVGQPLRRRRHGKRARRAAILCRQRGKRGPPAGGQRNPPQDPGGHGARAARRLHAGGIRGP